ncbi:MAG: gamma-glutamylcyclotransferase family protein [Gemmatimonadaceae bacterium]
MSAITPEGRTRVFVYGTLRQGQRNHGALDEARLVGSGETATLYTLRVDGTLPFLDPREPRYPVRGEVYELDSDTLGAIDHLERHPAWYRRRVISVRLDQRTHGSAHDVVTAFAYFHSEAPGAIHPTGDYADPMTATRATPLPTEKASWNAS